MKLSFISVFFLSSFFAVAQTKDLATLPQYDCSLTKVMHIVGKTTLLVVPEKSKDLETIVADYCATLGQNCVRKDEASLSGNEFSKGLFLVGVLSDFKNWAKYKIPVVKTAKGFRVNNKDFGDREDGFVFVDTNRIVISGNSTKAVKDAQLAFTGGHDLLITQGGKITYFGNANGKRFDWYNLQNLKTMNYTQKPSELFSSIYVSKTFHDTINYLQLNRELNSYAQQFLSVYKLKRPVKKVSWFIHSNMAEYGTMSGMFGLACPGNNSAGFSIRGEIHTNGFNVGLVKHEYSHYLFDATIPQDHNPAVFVEGCVEYVTSLNDTALFRQRVAVAKTYRDTLSYGDLIIRNKEFYGQYSAANYAISGIFVEYLIDHFGVDAFKRYCLAADKQTASLAIYKKPFDQLINDYKSWLEKQ